MPDAVILGIESSCDETGAAVVRSGQEILSNVVASQIATHQPYGGVVPELASREHLRAIVPVVRQALLEAKHTYQSVDAIAVTQGPGLAGALLVGISFAKGLAFALEKPLIAVNHIEGHIHAVLLEQWRALLPDVSHSTAKSAVECGTQVEVGAQAQQENDGDRADLQFPVLALVVSGGHTHLYVAHADGDLWRYEDIGHTRDDAAGEAYDKVAKLLGLGYPGGPIIDRLAPHGNPTAVKFQTSQIKHRDRRDREAPEQQNHPRFDFSYSGIKTAVLRYVETHNFAPSIEHRRRTLSEIEKPALEEYLRLADEQTLGLIASFQRSMVEDLVEKTLAAAAAYDVQTLFVSGGVAANRELRATFQREAEMQGLPVFFPSRSLSTDNAAMIAAAGYPKFLVRDFVPMDFSAEAGMVLGGSERRS